MNDAWVFKHVFFKVDSKNVVFLTSYLYLILMIVLEEISLKGAVFMKKGVHLL
jgi:hypothetical protein